MRRIAVARVLYLKSRGNKHHQIVGMMKELGFKFYRHLLYTRQIRGGTVVGWPERFGWDKELASVGIYPRKRKDANKHRFEDWLHRTQRNGGMKWSWRFQREIYGKLAEVTAGRCKRLMIFMPPRHGKTELVTQRYVAWRLLEDAGLNVILGSYSQQLASRFSRRAKRVWEEEFQAREEFLPAKDAKADPKRNGESGVGTPDGENYPVVEGSFEEKGSENIQVHPRSSLKNKTPRLRGSAVKATTRRSNAVAEWETGYGGGVRAVGVGGGIAGFGAGLIVIDDPVRNRQDAESESKRDTLDDWFKSDIYTRLEPDGAIILIQTRWHEDDLAGRLLRQMEEGGDKWDVVSLPAIAEEEDSSQESENSRQEEEEVFLQGSKGMEEDKEEEGVGSENILVHPCSSLKENTPPRLGEKHLDRSASDIPHSSFRVPHSPARLPGEALCPERYTIKDLKRIRREIGAYNFAALYQQRPIPLEGGQFKRKWFRQVIDYTPEGLDWKRGYDLAASTKTSADYTASFRVAVDKNGNLYIADGYRAKVEYPEQRRFIVEKMRTESNTEHGIEAALHGKAVVQDLRADRSVSGALKEVAVTSDKLSRALAWLNLAEAGKVFLIRGPWITAFVDEIASFPKGRHDDQIDAVSTAVSMLLIPGERKYKAGGF